MTKRNVENQREHDIVDTPVSTDTYKETALFQANAVLKEAVKESAETKDKKASACNDIIQLFKDFTKTNCDTKKQQLFLEANINFKAKKGVCRDDAIKLSPTASAVISATMRYIKKGLKITDETTYSKIKTEFTVKPSKAQTEALSNFKKHSLENQQIALKLVAEYIATKEAEKQAEHEAKKQAENEAKNNVIVEATITKKPAKNKRKKGAMADLVGAIV
jgi:hypothetical protein